jgi:RyR domain
MKENQMLLPLDMQKLSGEELYARRQMFAVAEHAQALLARSVRELLGEEQHDQRIFTRDEQTRRIDALMQCAYDGALTSRQRHEGWCKMHIEQGWVFGLEFNPAMKTHPNLMEWEDLPQSAKIKADIFALIASMTADMFVVARELLGHSVVLQQVQALAEIPYVDDEGDYTTEGKENSAEYRLGVVRQLLKFGDTQPFIAEVTERAERIAELNGHDLDKDTCDAFIEALTVPR